jgi:hypothetical protein
MPESRNFAPHRSLLCVALLLALTTCVQAQRLPLPPDEQDAVNRAIDRGVAGLKKAQLPNGTWQQPKKDHQVGYAVLPALTLLECGVPANDPVIQRAARFVRAEAAKLDGTYELALAILFLDRLGDPKDDKLIRGFDLRLIAGQSMTGGWGYKCPILNGKAHMDLLTALRHLDPLPAQRTLSGRAQIPDKKSADTGSRMYEKDLESKADAKPIEKPSAKTAKEYTIPKNLLILPVISDSAKHLLQDPKEKSSDLIFATTDNSNTQFAMLALWVAQRHGVPMKRTAKLIERRFVTSQEADGGWGYFYQNGGGVGTSPSMTCAGLIGLAVSHGLSEQAPDGGKMKDPRVVNGLTALSRFVGVPEPKLGKPPMQNLYFLWSLERMAVLYNLPKIGDKDWYRWGAQVLVANEQPLGGWTKGGYPGSTPVLDTSLALLFLKQANLVKDLTAKLPFEATDLNNKVMEKLAPAPAPEKPSKAMVSTPAPKPEENLLKKAEKTDQLVSKPLETSLLSKPLGSEGPPGEANTAEADTAAVSKRKWIGLVLALVFVVVGGGLIVFLVVSQRSKASEEEEEDERPRKRKKRKKTEIGKH